MTKLLVDGREIDVPPEYTLLQACEAAGAEIPRFCFHERLSIAGNCRMCLIEVVGGPPKPQASCAMAVPLRHVRPIAKTESALNTVCPLLACVVLNRLERMAGIVPYEEENLDRVLNRTHRVSRHASRRG